MSDIRDNKSADRANNPLTDKACRLLMLKLLRFDVQQLAKIDGQLVHGRSCFAMSIEDSSFRLSLFFFQRRWRDCYCRPLSRRTRSYRYPRVPFLPFYVRSVFSINDITNSPGRFYFSCVTLLMKYRVNNGNNDGHSCSVTLFRNYIFCA